MPTHEICHRLVPGCPVGANRRHIPPVTIEFPVAKTHYFGKGIKRRLEKSKEAAEPAKYGDGRELHNALDNRGEVEGKDLVEGVLQQWRSVLSRGNPDDDAEARHLEQSLEDKVPAYFVCSRINRLIDKSRGPPKVAEILHVDVLRVWARIV